MLLSNKNSWPADTIHQDLLDIKSLLYDPCRFTCSRPVMESESIDYGAYKFRLNGFSILFRIAKITPTKVGQFVTLWKRTGNGPIQPYDYSNPIDLFIISTRKDNHFGQFVFPKSVLCEQGVLSVKGKDGKRAIRVYPSWDETLNQQAKKTQQWQMKYFLEMPQNREIDFARVKLLYSL